MKMKSKVLIFFLLIFLIVPKYVNSKGYWGYTKRRSVVCARPSKSSIIEKGKRVRILGEKKNKYRIKRGYILKKNVRVPVHEYAKTCRGTPYVWGGTSRRGFDCSGFVQYVYKRRGIKLPRTASEMARATRKVSRTNVRSGDLLFFRIRTSRISHVALALSNKKMIHAETHSGINIDTINSYKRWYSHAGRIIKKGR